MTLNHSKTWPVSTLAVVQLRVDPNGRTYSTQFDGDFITDIGNLQNRDVQQQQQQEESGNGTAAAASATAAAAAEQGVINRTESFGMENDAANNGVILPLSQQHVELFTIRTAAASATSHHCHPHKTVRTDTVSTILEQDNDADIEITEDGGKLAKIDEENANNREESGKMRRPSIRVDNWDLIYTENVAAAIGNGRSKLCPACTAARCNDASTHQLTNYKNKAITPDYNDRLLLDLPLDARKATTLRRHYYPEGGWGWIIILCSVLVHVLNVGLQLSCSQLASPGGEKFKTLPVHIAGTKSDLRSRKKSVISCENGEKLCWEINANKFFECSVKDLDSIDHVFQGAVRSFREECRNKQQPKNQSKALVVSKPCTLF